MMDIISAIDQATGCHQCGQPLGGSPSSDFCSESCQAVWHANRASGAPVPEGRIIVRLYTAPPTVPPAEPATSYSSGGIRWTRLEGTWRQLFGP